MNCLNLEIRENFGRKSPFETYFWKKINKLLNEGHSCVCTNDIYTRSSAKDYQGQYKRVKNG